MSDIKKILSIYPSIDPNLNYLKEDEIFALQIRNIEKKKVFPSFLNSGEFTTIYPTPNAHSVTLHDQLGNEISLEIDNGHILIPFQISKGIYFIRIVEEGSIDSFKIYIN